jgi:hypothetical protein
VLSGLRVVHTLDDIVDLGERREHGMDLQSRSLFRCELLFSLERELNRRTLGSEHRGSVSRATSASFITSMRMSCGQLDAETHARRAEYLEG